MKLKIDKDKLYDLYINQNKTREEISKLFNITSNQVKYLVKKYNIIKDRSLFAINIGNSQKGNIKSEETKNKISESRKNKPAWNKGLTKETDERVVQYSNSKLGQKRTKEQKELISKRTIEVMNNQEVKSKISKANKSRVYTDEQRFKRSIISKRLWTNPEYAKRCSNPKYGNKPIYNNIKYMSDTEMLFAKRLDLLNIKYNYQCGPFKYLLSTDNKEHNYYPDFYLPDYDLYLEIKYRKNYLYNDKIKVNDKINGMKKLGLNILLLDRNDLDNLYNIINNVAIG